MRPRGAVALTTTDMVHSVIHSDGRGAPLAEQTVRPKDHHEEKQDEEEELTECRCDVVSAQGLNHPDAYAAEQRAFDAAHAAQHHDDKSNQDEVQSDRWKDREKRQHDASGEAD